MTKKTELGSTAMVQQLRVRAAFAEGPELVPSTRVMWFTVPPVIQGLQHLCLLWALYPHVHTHKDTDTNTELKTKKNFFKIYLYYVYGVLPA